MPTPWLYPILFTTGIAAGFIDAIAGGGGLITLPALLWAGLPPQLALGTNKFQSTFGTGLAAWHYERAGLLRWRNLLLGMACTFLASLLGAWAVTRLDGRFLRYAIPPILILLALWFWLKPNLGHQSHPARLSPKIFAVLFGLLLGFYDGFFGPGTGSFWTVACIGLLGLDLPAATGYTKALNLASNLAALAFFLAAGLVRFDIGAVMLAGQLVGARLGSGLVIARGARFIRPIFLTMVLAIAARLLWQNWHSAV